MSGPSTPNRQTKGSGSPARTPHRHLIFSHDGSDSPLPPLIEVAGDDSPARVPLVSQADSPLSSRAQAVLSSLSRAGISVEALGDSDSDVSIHSEDELGVAVMGSDHHFDDTDADDQDHMGIAEEDEAAAIARHRDYDQMDEDEDEDEEGVLSGNYPEDSEENDDDEDEDEDDDDDDDDDDEDDYDGQGGNGTGSEGRGLDRGADVANQFAEMLAGRQDIRRNLFGFDLGAIPGMGNAQRFRPLIATLKRYDDQTAQLVALQEMAELLSISTEDSLIGLNLGELCQVLINLLKGADGDYDELTGFIVGNSDIMLLACRCLSNLLEALPYAGTILVRFGVVRVLCSKLMEIEYIDLAEQALSTLERISREFPANVCEAGGMSACLMFLDFFATSTQRTALSCAANCARGITSESFPQAREAMSVLERTVVFGDQKIAESSCVALLHLVSAFRSDSAKVEQLVSPELLKVVAECVQPDNTATASTPTTLLLQMLTVTVYSSRERTAQLLDLDIIPVLERILINKCIGHSAAQPSQAPQSQQRQQQNQQQHASSASVTRVPDQAWEALRLLVAILPRLPSTVGGLARAEELLNGGSVATVESGSDGRQLERLRAIEARPKVIKQLQLSLVPTMANIYLSTMNTAARYRTLLVILKIVFFLNTELLSTTLRDVSVSTFVANIISSPEYPLLSGISLLLIRLLLAKLPDVYAQRFIREGVADELGQLASFARTVMVRAEPSESAEETSSDGNNQGDMVEGADKDDGDGDSNDKTDLTCLAYGFKILNVHIPNSSRINPTGSARMFTLPAASANTAIPKDILQIYTWLCSQAQVLHNQLQAVEPPAAAGSDGSVLTRLKRISRQLSGQNDQSMRESIEELAACLESPDSVTCYELMQSGIIDSLLAIVGRKDTDSDLASQLIMCLLRAQGDAVPAFVILVSRLHEALNMTEDIRIQEAYQTPSDETRSAAHMLTKQLRFKVVPADDSTVAALTGALNNEPLAREMTATMNRIRQAFQNITVSVHAIATFSVLEVYLRPRIALSIGQNRRRRHRHRHTQQLKPGNEQGASAVPKEEGNADASQRPQQAQLERQPGGLEQGSSSQRRSNKSRRPDESQLAHIRMLQRIAQASNINVRASGLFDGLGSDMDDDGDTFSSDSESDGDGDQDMAEEKGDGDQVMEERSGDGDNKTQDWHLVFKLKTEDDERVVSSEENIFRVVSSMCQQSEALRTANPWAQVFTLQFHVEFGQDKSDDAASIAEQRAQLESPDLQQLGEMFGHQCAVIIELIKQLHDHLPQAVRILHQKRLVSEDSELFINRKVAAKATRQLDDPLHVVCGAIPRWCHQLVHYAPFLVPFDTRLAYLQATSFGYSRNISRWQTLAQREARSGSSRTSDLQIPLGRIQRQKVRISRHRMLESALKVMDLYGTAKTILEVEYFQEVGTGLGPTLEFYATVSRSLRDKSLELWRDPTGAAAPAAATNADDKPADPEYIDSRLGLFPRAINPELAGSPSETQDGSEAGRALSPTERAAQLFKFLGHFVAKGLIDGRILDLPLHEEFWAAVQRYSVDSNAETDLAWSWAQLEHVDPAQTKSLQYLQQFVDQRTEIYQRDGLTAEQKMVQAEAIRDPKTGASVDDLSLDFTLPGYPEIEMREGGSSIPVTINNLPVYIDQVAQWTLGKGIQRQVRAFCDGFNKIFSVRDLSIFAPAELSRLVGPSSDSEDWSMATLLSTVKADHGFSLASPAVKMFLDFMESLDSTGRRRFLRFVTGSPQLPFGGFRALHPPLTLVHKPHEAPLTPDDYLPSVMTCANYIKLPNYSTPEVLAERWNRAVTEGQQSFHLS